MLAAISLSLLGLFQSPQIPVQYTLDEALLRKTYSFKEVKFEPLEDGEPRRKASEAIWEELARYPKPLLKKTLSSVTLITKLSFDGTPFGGTYLLSNKQIILCLFFDKDGFIDYWLRESLHHEFSSLLLIKFSKQFPQQEWLRANDPAFRYSFPDKGFEAAKEGKGDQTFDPAIQAQGFVSQYGMSDMENDCNTFAGAIMGPRCTQFWQCVAQFPRLKTKAEILLRFYKRIDKDFEIPSTVPQDVVQEVSASAK